MKKIVYMIIILSLLFFMTLSCSVTSGTGTDVDGDDGYRVLAIHDAAHGGDVENFYFLPPLVSNPSASGVFNSSASPVVEIVELSSDGTYDPDNPITVFTMGEGSEHVKVGSEDEHYAVNWHTKNYELYTDLTYRIRIEIDSDELGFADVVVVNSGKDIKAADSDETKALKNGRTIPIKFRIEEVTTDQKSIW